MTRQQKYALFLTIGCFLTAISFDFYLKYSSKLDKYTEQIEEVLHEQEAATRRFFDNKEFIQQQLAGDKTIAPQQQLKDYEYIRNLAKEAYTVMIGWF